ncbi:MAG TPA: replication-associated recombination protein A [Candidatus Hydrothermia bacterium]|nr:replication-associated recombination protein A [Candidatus Hydrothermae bacterium]MDD3648834.1 replication-associated recombination protein A [Candidatus Hydrothermia bacterium]MDD5572348.1 replication-associated recombination protein A [Candidatus Hydrothermia bacterium]HOK23338.1 replication-associated recombination protein A [Candidatus Hydrothermia bacterium]HOL24148.1 replication-associated recombination protein A [Candidatus Hydrothermia bacterium]
MQFDFFEKEKRDFIPLSVVLAPQKLEEFVGQEHLVGQGKPLRVLIENGRLKSSIFFGPPGCGKTALARIIANLVNTKFQEVNAARIKPSEIKKLVDYLVNIYKSSGKPAILYLDEIHRLNRLHQEFFLPFTEEGSLILIASTTHNPFFAISNALISRSMLFEFKPLMPHDIVTILERAKFYLKDHYSVEVSQRAIEIITDMSEGDARRALNLLEMALLVVQRQGGPIINDDLIKDIMPQRVFSLTEDEHYDMISALIKSIRGSDPDAAVYWLVRLLEQGEDPLYIIRRLFIHSCEDIGLEDPDAVKVVQACKDGFEMVGRPEGDIILTFAVLYLSLAKKSNAVVRTLANAREVIRKTGNLPVPMYLRDANYKGAVRIGRGVGYIYPYGENRGVRQVYLPEEIKGMKIFKKEEPE